MSWTFSSSKNRPDPVRPPRHEPETLEKPSAPSRRRSNASSVVSFHSAHFPPEEEARLLDASNDLKTIANAQFARQDYSSALSTYDKAVAECPSYLDYEQAVLSSNIAACYLRLEDWREALHAADRGMEGLEKILPLPKAKDQHTTQSDHKVASGDARGKVDVDDSKVVELPEDATDLHVEELIEHLNLSDQRRADIHRIRTKLLLRRARARYMLGTNSSRPGESKPADDAQTTSSAWSNLSAAQSDYQLLMTPPYQSTLPPSDLKTVRDALATLPPLIEQAKDREVKEMMGKLKDLGNGLLRPFGLSTDMFKMEQDEKTGGMSLKFDGGTRK